MSTSDGAAEAKAEQTVLERPSPGPSRGAFPVPAWVVVALGAAVVSFFVLVIVRRTLGKVRR